MQRLNRISYKLADKMSAMGIPVLLYPLWTRAIPEINERVEAAIWEYGELVCTDSVYPSLHMFVYKHRTIPVCYTSDYWMEYYATCTSSKKA